MEKPDESKIKFWIPRSELLNCFQEVIKQKQRDHGSDCKIRVMYESSCDGFYIPSESFDKKITETTSAAATASVAAASTNSETSAPCDPHRLHVRITTSPSAQSIPCTSDTSTRTSGITTNVGDAVVGNGTPVVVEVSPDLL